MLKKKTVHRIWCIFNFTDLCRHSLPASLYELLSGKILDGANTSGKVTSVICVFFLFFSFPPSRCLQSVHFDIFTQDFCLFCFPVTDLQFSQTIHGRPVPFATAGDCYSAAKCPQVGQVTPHGNDVYREKKVPASLLITSDFTFFVTLSQIIKSIIRSEKDNPSKCIEWFSSGYLKSSPNQPDPVKNIYI